MILNVSRNKMIFIILILLSVLGDGSKAFPWRLVRAATYAIVGSFTAVEAVTWERSRARVSSRKYRRGVMKIFHQRTWHDIGRQRTEFLFIVIYVFSALLFFFAALYNWSEKTKGLIGILFTSQTVSTSCKWLGKQIVPFYIATVIDRMMAIVIAGYFC